MLVVPLALIDPAVLVVPLKLLVPPRVSEPVPPPGVPAFVVPEKPPLGVLVAPPAPP